MIGVYTYIRVTGMMKVQMVLRISFPQHPALTLTSAEIRGAGPTGMKG